MERLRTALLQFLARTSTRHPNLVLAIALLFAAAAVAYTTADLELLADRNQLIRPGRDWNERFEQYRRDFAGTRDLIVVLQGGTVEARREYAEVLARELDDDARVDSVFHRVDPDEFAGRRLLLSTEEQLDELAQTLRDEADALERLTARPGLESILRWVDGRVSSALVSTMVSGLFGTSASEEETAEDAEDAPQPLDLGFLITLLEGMRDRLAPDGAEPPPFESPWASFLGDTDAGYLTADAGQLHLVVVTPKSGDGYRSDARTIDVLRERFAELGDSFPGVRAGVTGQRAINAAEMRASVQDTRRAALWALAGVALVFVVGFGRVANPLLAVVALLFGIAWSAGATTLLVGHLTVLSVAFTSILVGLGIDFGIHVVSRYEEARGRGMDARPAAEAAVLGSGPGNLAGAVTTALAFFGVALSDFLGLAELGLIAGAGVLLCLVAALLVLPALLTRFPTRPGRRRAARAAGPAWLDRVPMRWVMGGLVVAALGFAVAPGVSFDSNLLELQAEGVEAVDLELRLIGAEGRGSAFAVSVVSDLEAAVELGEKLEALPEVRDVESLARIVPPDPEPRIEAARRIGRILDEMSLERGAPQPIQPDRIARRIDKLRFKLRPEKDDAWDPERKPDARDLERVRPLLDDVRSRLDARSSEAVVAALEPYQARVVDDLFDRLDTLERETDPKPLTIDEVPESVRRRLVGRDGRLLVRIHPADNIWEDEARARFVEALRAVDPDVTGIPVQSHESSRLMLRGYLQGGLYSLVVVLLVLFLDLRRPVDVAMALIPLVVGWGLTFGAMVALGLDFNLANLIILPLMIGIGIDIGIHCVHRFRDDGSAGSALVGGSTGRAVILSGLTTAIGFGSLAIARHRGIHSLGLLLAIGVLANVVAATLVLAPALRARVTRRS